MACFASGQAEAGMLLTVVAAVWCFFHLLRVSRGAPTSPASLPESSKRILEGCVRFYTDLPQDWRRDFESRVAQFIGANRFVGVRTQEATEELKVLAAASAVILRFGHEDWTYPRIPEILFYSNSFDDEFHTKGQGRHISGMTHPWGTIVLSGPDLRRSFRVPNDGYHVGLHEFAHLLDLRNQDWDGLPEGLDPQAARPWADLIDAEMNRAREGRSVLGDYAGTNEAETFAVAVEVFFERPDKFQKANPELFKALEDYFGLLDHKHNDKFKRRSTGRDRRPGEGRRSPRTPSTE